MTTSSRPQEELPCVLLARQADQAADRYHEVEVDNVELKIRNGKAFQSCPICHKMEYYADLGRHLSKCHQVSSLICPGQRCQGGVQCVSKYHQHVRHHHFRIECSVCGTHLRNPRTYSQHLQSHCPCNFSSIPLQPVVQKAVPAAARPALVILQRRPSSSRPPGTRVSRNYEVLLNGKLVIVDGLSFYVRNEVIFMDCFLCCKSMALSANSSHLRETHACDFVTCKAVGCKVKVSWKQLEQHILAHHSHLECHGCQQVLPLWQVATHPHFFFSKPDVRACGVRAVGASAAQLPQHRQAEPQCTPSQSGNLVSGCEANKVSGKIPTVPCPYCGKQCSYLNKHIRDVHQPKIHCQICGKRIGKSYLSEHMKIQHQGKQVPTRVCPLCGTRVQKLKNHLKYSHKLSREQADHLHAQYFPTDADPASAAIGEHPPDGPRVAFGLLPTKSRHLASGARSELMDQ